MMSYPRHTVKNVAISSIALFLLIIFFSMGCEDEIERILKVKTDAVSKIDYTSCIVSGTILDKGEDKIDLHGFCYALTEEPTLSGHVIRLGSRSTLGSFLDTITGLAVNTTYYVRAFARNEIDTYFGEQISFQTLAFGPPLVTTTPATNQSNTEATIGGEVTDDGGAEVTERGVWYSTSPDPETTGTQIKVGSGIGAFSTDLTGLTIATAYYTRAYALNSLGNSYGDELVFLTNRKPSVSTEPVVSITLTSVRVRGDVYDDGGEEITDRGVYYSTSPDAETTGMKFDIGSGKGTFSKVLEGLTKGTLYYIKAYATNSIGTAYGNEISFSTLIDDSDGNIYRTIQIEDQLWMAENLKTTKYSDGTEIPIITSTSAWESLESPAYCWYGNNIQNKDTYGALYNWYAVDPSSNGSKNVCPPNWHVPTLEEWLTLIDYLGGEEIAGRILKEAGGDHWEHQNIGTNEVGFTALPGGYRQEYGAFREIGKYGRWWTTTVDDDDEDNARQIEMIDEEDYAGKWPVDKRQGLSVRCIRD